MRDPERIKRICKLIEEQWLKYPDQRLGQFLLNFVFGRVNHPKIFIQEDKITEENLKKLEPIIIK